MQVKCYRCRYLPNATVPPHHATCTPARHVARSHSDPASLFCCFRASDASQTKEAQTRISVCFHGHLMPDCNKSHFTFNEKFFLRVHFHFRFYNIACLLLLLFFRKLRGCYSGYSGGAENTSGKQMVGRVAPLKTEISYTVCTIRFPLARRKLSSPLCLLPLMCLAINSGPHPRF